MQQDKSRQTKLKMAVDIACGFFILVFLCGPWALLIAPPDNGEMIVNLSLLFGLPTLFAIIWLEVRYAEVLENRFPGISRWQAKIVFVLLFITMFIPIRMAMHPT